MFNLKNKLSLKLKGVNLSLGMLSVVDLNEIDSIVLYDRNSQLFDKTLLRFGGIFCFFIIIEWFTYLTLLFSVDSQNIERRVPGKTR